MTRHVLAGLRPEPLSSYLAGLGLIRLIGEQTDPGATAAWGTAGLIIETTVDDLAEWLAAKYVPTPVLSPWNGGSGFGAKDVEPKRRIAAIQAHASPPLASFRAAIAVADQVGGKARAEGWIGDGGNGQDKDRAVQEFRNRCPDALLPWIDAAVVLAEDGVHFPPLLGTGGNDGRLDFSTNFQPDDLDEAVGVRMQRQQILYQSGKRFHFVITEAVLRYRLCPPEAMLGQLDRLVTLSTMPAIRFGVIPFVAKLPLAPVHGFWLMDERVVVVENFTASQNLTQVSEISSYARIFDQLADVARYGSGARSIVTRSLVDLSTLPN